MTSAPVPFAADLPRRGLAGRLLALAAPVAGSNILLMAMGLVDVIIVGRHSATELAELALAWSLNGTALVGTMGLLLGVQVLCARRMGEGRPEAVGAIWRRGIVTALLAGLIMGLLLHFGALAALSHLGQDPELAQGAAACAAILGLSLAPNAVYATCAKTLEGLNRPRAALVLLAAANVVNLILCLWLVPRFGSEGAAWSTLGARTVMMTGVLAWLLFLMPGAAQFGFLRHGTQSQGGEAREQLSIGFAALGSRVLEAGAFNALTVIAGIAGAAAIASFTIAMNVISLGFMPALGIASATAVIASHARGAGDMATAWRVTWLGLAWSLSFGALFAVCVVVFDESITAIFTKDPAVLASGAVVVALLALVSLPDFTQVTAADALRALGKPWFPTASHLASYICVMAPLGYVLCVTLDRGAPGLVEAVAIASVLSATVLLGRLWLLWRSASGHTRQA